MTIINNDVNIVIKWSFKLIDATTGIIYDRHMFMVHATGYSVNFALASKILIVRSSREILWIDFLGLYLQHNFLCNFYMDPIS